MCCLLVLLAQELVKQICALVFLVAVLLLPPQRLPRVHPLLASFVRRLRWSRMLTVVWAEGRLQSELFALRTPSSVWPFRSGCA